MDYKDRHIAPMARHPSAGRNANKSSALQHVDASHVLTAFTAVTMSAPVTAGFIFRPQGRVVLGQAILTTVGYFIAIALAMTPWQEPST